MTLKDVKTMLDKLAIPVTFIEWKKGQAPKLPYILYNKGSSSDVIADNYNFIEKHTVYIELYQDSVVYDFGLEKRLRELLKDNKIPFTRDEIVSIPSEQMYLTSFYITIKEN